MEGRCRPRSCSSPKQPFVHGVDVVVLMGATRPITALLLVGCQECDCCVAETQRLEFRPEEDIQALQMARKDWVGVMCSLFGATFGSVREGVVPSRAEPTRLS